MRARSNDLLHKQDKIDIHTRAFAKRICITGRYTRAKKVGASTGFSFTGADFCVIFGLPGKNTSVARENRIIIVRQITDRPKRKRVMDEVVHSLEQSIARDQEILLQLRTYFDELLVEVREHQESLGPFRMELKFLEQIEGGEDLYYHAMMKLKVATEYYGRIISYSQYFQDNFSKLLYFIKRVYLQVSMARSQVKFQYDALNDPEVMEKFSENIKLLVQLVKSASERITQLQSYYAISLELMTQAKAIRKNIGDRLAAMRPETA